MPESDETEDAAGSSSSSTAADRRKTSKPKGAGKGKKPDKPPPVPKGKSPCITKKFLVKDFPGCEELFYPGPFQYLPIHAITWVVTCSPYSKIKELKFLEEQQPPLSRHTRFRGLTNIYDYGVILRGMFCGSVPTKGGFGLSADPPMTVSYAAAHPVPFWRYRQWQMLRTAGNGSTIDDYFAVNNKKKVEEEEEEEEKEEEEKEKEEKDEEDAGALTQNTLPGRFIVMTNNDSKGHFIADENVYFDGLDDARKKKLAEVTKLECKGDDGASLSSTTTFPACSVAPCTPFLQIN